jgi:hypothetical protein
MGTHFPTLSWLAISQVCAGASHAGMDTTGHADMHGGERKPQSCCTPTPTSSATATEALTTPPTNAPTCS